MIKASDFFVVGKKFGGGLKSKKREKTTKDEIAMKLLVSTIFSPFHLFKWTTYQKTHPMKLSRKLK
jgi:hypothetical protein